MATYVIINLLVLAGLVPGLILMRRRPGRAWGITLIALLVLTAIFDNVIVGLGIVRYHEALILGLRIGVVPVEDFFYALAAALMIPALWQKAGRHG